MRHPASRHRRARTTLSNLVGPLATTVTLTMLMHLSIAAACCAPASPATVAAEPLTPGVLQHRTLLSDPLLAYYLYVPKSVGPGARLFVTVHGISRRALQHASMFAPFAEQQGVVLIAPYFPADRFPDYQRMSRAGRGERSDQALERIVAEVGRLSGANTASYSCSAIPVARSLCIASPWRTPSGWRDSSLAPRVGTHSLTQP